jgi:hypothetical protein
MPTDTATTTLDAEATLLNTLRRGLLTPQRRFSMLRRRFSSDTATKILDVEATLLDAAAITHLTLQRRCLMLRRRFSMLQRSLI